MAFPAETLLITDGTRDADLAARPAWDLADQSGAETYLLYGHRLVMLGLGVERCLRHRDRLDGLVEGVKYAEGNVAEAEPQARAANRQGRRAHCIDMAEELGADLIVAGSRGLSGIKRARMGSVSESIVRHAYYPVLDVCCQVHAHNSLMWP